MRGARPADTLPQEEVTALHRGIGEVPEGRVPEVEFDTVESAVVEPPQCPADVRLDGAVCLSVEKFSSVPDSCCMNLRRCNSMVKSVKEFVNRAHDLCRLSDANLYVDDAPPIRMGHVCRRRCMVLHDTMRDLLIGKPGCSETKAGAWKLYRIRGHLAVLDRLETAWAGCEAHIESSGDSTLSMADELGDDWSTATDEHPASVLKPKMQDEQAQGDLQRRQGTSGNWSASMGSRNPGPSTLTQLKQTWILTILFIVAMYGVCACCYPRRR